MTNTISPAELCVQREYCEKIKTLLPPSPLACVQTFGCQQNEADSERLRGMLAAMGCAETRDSRSADIIVLNTCAVREHAEQRVFGNVGALSHGKRDKPSQLIAVCGCMAQQAHAADIFKRSYPYVDIVFGPHALWRFPELVHRRLTRGERVFDVAPEDGSVAEGVPQLRDSKVKAWVSVMYGCNNFCSYCVVPYVRGRERSRAPGDIIAEIRGLVKDGCRDVTLLGQNVNSYDPDFPGLLREINRIDGDFLIRFMTSHPKDAGEPLFAAMRDCEKCAPHLHLPFQSGSSEILRRMNRRYTREQYLEKVALAREYIPGLTLTSDVIVGFPGETEEDFSQTLSLVEAVGFHALFTFIYSPRKGTPAAELPDNTPRAEKQARFDRLLNVQNAVSARLHADMTGKTLRVLVDGPGEADSGFSLSGRTAGGRLVRLNGPRELIGGFADVKITGSTTWSLTGERI